MRIIKTQVRCGDCRRWVSHTSFDPGQNRFVCRRCFGKGRPEKAEKIKTTRFHFVRKEETLSAISQQYYGDRNKWRKILEANKSVIKDPKLITPTGKFNVHNTQHDVY